MLFGHTLLVFGVIFLGHFLIGLGDNISCPKKYSVIKE